MYDARDKRQKLMIETLDKVFEYLDDKVRRENVTKNYSCQIEFHRLSLIKDTDNSILNFNINKQSAKLFRHFDKQTSEDCNIKQVYFLSESYGLILISNSPLDKSSIYYFNIQSRTNLIF